jgi:hypothetical protein
MRLPSKGPNSPFSAGQRTLLARTCRKCGELADADSFPVLNAGTKNQARRKVCHVCTNLQKKQDREERGIGVPAPRPPEELQTSRYRLWTAEDDQIMRDGIAGGDSYEAIAVKLGRSLRSVYKRRSDLGLAGVRKRHRVAKPWKLDVKRL